jgi:predicted ester cyclase
MNKQETISAYWFEKGWNQGIEETIDEIFSTDLVAHGLGPDGVIRGTEGFRKFYRDFKEQFKDIKIDVPISIKKGNIESTLTHVTLTDRVSGKVVTFSGICMARILDGKAVEVWNQYDFLSMYQQLGMTLQPAT